MKTVFLSNVLISIRNKPLSSFISIVGMSLGLAIFILVNTYTMIEKSVNKSFPEYRNIYRLSIGDGLGHQGTPAKLGEILNNSLPAIKSFTRIVDGGSGYYINAGINPVSIDRLTFADSTFFKIFPLRFVSGNPATCLSNRFDMVITETLAKRLFGKDDPVGQTVRLNNKTDITITAIIEDPGSHTHITGDAFISFHSLPTFKGNPDLFDCHSCYNYQTYLLLDSNTDFSKIQGVVNETIHDFGTRYSIASMQEETYALSNLNDVYFGSEERPSFRKGNRLQIKTMSTIGFLAVLIALINSSIMATAQTINSIRALGIRKSLGASKHVLILGILGESVIIALLSVVLGFSEAQMLLPSFSSIIGTEIMFNKIDLPILILRVLFFALSAGLISGIYPALKLSGISTSSTLRGIIVKGREEPATRRILIIIQIAVSLVLTICTLLLRQQLTLIDQHDPGFDRNKLLYVNLNEEIKDRKESFRTRLLESPYIENVSFSYASYRTSNESWGMPYNGEDIQLNIEAVDKNYLNTLGMDLIDGRNFNGRQDNMKLIVNEAACRKYFGSSPVGSKIEALGERAEIIGVIKDFNYETYHKNIEPIALVHVESWANLCSIRFVSDKSDMAIFHLEKIWKEFSPGAPFSYHFVDELYHERYSKERGIAKILGFFSIVTILISCLGVYAVSRFTVLMRLREIGIRKVFGATEGRIAVLLSKQITENMIWAIAPAFLVTLVFIDRWLSVFVIRISIGPWVFITGSLLIWCLILLAISGQILRATRMNPVETIKVN